MPRAGAERLAAWDGARTGVARALQEIEQRLLAERAQHLSTYLALEALVASGGTLRVSEFADALVLPRPTATRTCDRLEAEGFIRRERVEGDGRAVDVVLTRSGREEYRRCQPAYERFVEDVFGRRVSDGDVAALLRVSRALSSR